MVDISSFLKPFYGDDHEEPPRLMQENRHLRDELAAARRLLERRNQELESLRKVADYGFVQSPTSSIMFVEHETQTTSSNIQHSQPPIANVHIGISNCASIPLVEDEIITAKVERIIPIASVGKAWNRSTSPLPRTTESYCSCEIDTGSTCSLSLTAEKYDEHEELEGLIIIGDKETDRPFEGSSAQAFSPSLRLGSAVSACAAEDTRIHSDVTTKVRNTTNNAKGGGLMKHHESIHSIHQSPTTSRDSFVLTPLQRLASTHQLPIRRAGEIMIHPQAMTLEVEKQDLRDALQRKGTYTGSIDSRTLLPDGFGTMIYENEEYEGDWEQGYYHGHGKHTNAQGDVYEGPFHYGLKQGKDKAIMNFGDGRRFRGRFHADKMREGVLEFVDGSWYEGLLENDKRDGYGVCCFASGDEYEGQWKDDVMHGHGRMDWKSDASWYNGEWEFGIIHGMGTKVDTNGNIVHQGYFYDGAPVIVAEAIYENSVF